MLTCRRITIAAELAGETSRIAGDVTRLLRVRHRIGKGDGSRRRVCPTTSPFAPRRRRHCRKGLYTSAAVFVLANLPQLDQITPKQMSGTLQQTSNTLTALLASIAAISLVVGGIGIMNIMLVSVTERTREIGLRLAVGARGRDVLVQFLIEAFTLSVVGGLIGVAFGFVASSVVTQAARVADEDVGGRGGAGVRHGARRRGVLRVLSGAKGVAARSDRRTEIRVERSVTTMTDMRTPACHRHCSSCVASLGRGLLDIRRTERAGAAAAGATPAAEARYPAERRHRALAGPDARSSPRS